MSHLQGKIAEARAKLMSARVVIAAARNDLAAARAGLAEALAAVIHVVDDEDDDDDMGFFPDDARGAKWSPPACAPMTAPTPQVTPVASNM
jgi:hypothetical protein